MTGLQRAEGYLTLNPNFSARFTRIHRSNRADALEYSDGRTLAVDEEVKELLAGVFHNPPVCRFPYVLNLFALMKFGPDVWDVTVPDTLAEAYTRARGAAGLTRNAGMLIGELCRGLDPAPAGLKLELVLLSIGRPRLAYATDRPADQPVLTRNAFEQELTRRLAVWPLDRLVHWLRFGTDPLPAQPRLIEPLESLPDRIAQVLELARTSDRLVGATTLIPTLDAAVTVPPRRRSAESLPQGGYADVTTRGEPDRLLLSQFALETDEFIRRFASRELLYFEREEPHVGRRPKRVIVLDQGVRTWGTVRLALAAAALSILKADPRSFDQIELFMTSIDTAVNPREGDLQTLTRHLEASDLTASPAACLTRALGSSLAEKQDRDVILLTHPRNLAEPAVIAAAHARTDLDRLFTLSVEADGRVEFAEWTRSGIKPVRHFRVDLHAAEAARVETNRAPRPVVSIQSSGWTGDVEPIRFPFRPGLVADVAVLGFDADGEWLVTASREGMFHGLTLDGAPPEVLPRPLFGGKLLRHVEAILGVKNGVVVCGRLKLSSETLYAMPNTVGNVTIVSGNKPVVSSSASPLEPEVIEHFAVAWYDQPTHEVKVISLGPAFPNGIWSVFPDLNCVAIASPEYVGRAVDLTTAGQFPGPDSTNLSSRAQVAWSRVKTGSPPYVLPVRTRWSAGVSIDDSPSVFLDGNTMRVKSGGSDWQPFEPKRDGKPLLGGAVINQAQLAGTVLAMSIKRGEERSLVVFRGPEGSVISESPHTAGTPFTLSQDGRLIACVESRDLVVRSIGRPGAGLALAAEARTHNDLRVQVSSSGMPYSLYIHAERFLHSFELKDNRLFHTVEDKRNHPARKKERPPKCTLTDYDWDRFPLESSVSTYDSDDDFRLFAIPDRLGQVLLIKETGASSVVLATFMVSRGLWAGWLPGEGDVFCGDAALIGGPPTSNAEEIIGRALRDALFEAVCLGE